MICLIGNSGIKKHGLDGQTVKVRLYLKKIKDEGFEVDFIDLENFSRHPFLILRRIKKAIKQCDRIVLITAERGSKVLIPYINKINKKYRKPFIFPLVGTSVLHYSIDRLNEEQKNSFLLNCDFGSIKPKIKLVRELSKITYIFPETEQLCEVFRRFYGLSNVYPLTNFRDAEILTSKKKSISRPIKLIFLSRVMREKGIFDLIDCAQDINKLERIVTLDIYGQLCFDKNDTAKFKNQINNNTISYHGPVDSKNVVDTISKYDIFVFPTRFVGEGVPGVIVESLISGTPVLTSDFPQARTIINDGYDSVTFEMFDKEDLMAKLLHMISDEKVLLKLSSGALETGKKLLYSRVRNDFLKFVCGSNK